MKLFSKVVAIINGTPPPKTGVERVATAEANRKVARLELEEALREFAENRTGKTKHATN